MKLYDAAHLLRWYVTNNYPTLEIMQRVVPAFDTAFDTALEADREVEVEEDEDDI